MASSYKVGKQVYHLADLFGLPVYVDEGTGKLKAKHKFRVEFLPDIIVVCNLVYSSRPPNGDLVAVYQFGVSWDSKFYVVVTVPPEVKGTSLFFVDGSNVEVDWSKKYPVKELAALLKTGLVRDFSQPSATAYFE